jgi:hypothetical protein
MILFASLDHKIIANARRLAVVHGAGGMILTILLPGMPWTNLSVFTSKGQLQTM